MPDRLGENIQNQRAAIQNGHTDDLLQRPDIAGRKLIVKNHHGGFRSFRQHPHFHGLALTDKAVGIRGVPVLQNLSGAETAGSFQQGFQFFDGLVCCGLLLCKAIRIQSHQYGTLLLRIKSSFHIFLLLRSYFLVYHTISGAGNPHIKK